jgi:2-oxoglutarate/2-oxoacid ferredoxin oxidoreductase subunit beta
MKEDTNIAWCPGCGNFAILDALKKAVAELEIAPQKLVIASGIGQADKLPHYFNAHMFNGLHGRTLPGATGIKATNPELTVIAVGGDSDMYAEGGNHFLHAIRRNVNLTHIVHNNMVYGLTKGQASPTSKLGFKSPVQTEGVIEQPFNPIAIAIAIAHKGYALVDIFQPCVTFNKVNTFKWFKDHTYYLDQNYKSDDKNAAFAKSLEEEKFPLGIIFQQPERKTFEDQLSAYHTTKNPLYQRPISKLKK